MRCSQFRKHHLAYVDDTLPGCMIAAMERHLAECGACARLDASVRRGLLLVRNLPPIQPSPDFRARLDARLRAMGPVNREVPVTATGPGAGTFAAAAAALALAAFLGMSYYAHATTIDRDLSLPPVIATAPAPEPSPIATPAIVASVSTGFPMWQAVLLAEQAPMHLIRAEFHESDAAAGMAQAGMTR